MSRRLAGSLNTDVPAPKESGAETRGGNRHHGASVMLSPNRTGWRPSFAR